jgi:D-glycero-D-manno-heptose 1,7-bisphosphate phosphatase
METLLGGMGAYIDDLFYCPHHPDKDFSGGPARYELDCDCRKPKPGLFIRAAEKYNIDLASSYMVGYDNRDEQAALAAGVKPIMLGRDCTDLYEFVRARIAS